MNGLLTGSRILQTGDRAIRILLEAFETVFRLMKEIVVLTTQLSKRKDLLAKLSGEFQRGTRGDPIA